MFLFRRAYFQSLFQSTLVISMCSLSYATSRSWIWQVSHLLFHQVVKLSLNICLRNVIPIYSTNLQNSLLCGWMHIRITDKLSKIKSFWNYSKLIFIPQIVTQPNIARKERKHHLIWEMISTATQCS